MKSIVWMASYPKSGNTWLRLFLCNYLLRPEEPIPLKKASQIAFGDAEAINYRKVARAPIDLRNEEIILRLRPAVLKAISQNGADINLIKTHNQNNSVRGTQMIPPAITRLAIYIVRNPLDVIISYANHYGSTLNAAALAISSASTKILPSEDTVAQYIGSWSDHVKSWTTTNKFPICVLRYEDMLEDPERAFSTALKRMGVPVEIERLRRAVEFSSFDQLRSQEEAHGFVEKSRHAERFFRVGAAGQWREKLSPEVVAQIRATHGTVMRRFGYLEE